jgi:archaeoflavoprotein AfpA
MGNNEKSKKSASASTQAVEKRFKLAWGITGAGDLIADIFDAMKDLKESGQFKITALLSKAAVKVLKAYRLTDTLPAIADKIMIEKDANTPFVVGALQTRKYDALLVAPVTGNSAAKIAHGIADTLITNAVAMTTRTNTPVYVLPVEKEGNEVNTTLPDGSRLELFTRDLDAQNTAKLAQIKGVTVLDAPEDIKKIWADQ